MKTSRIRVTLMEVEPTVVRVIDVPAGVLLPELHDLLQVALGWTDSHLHQFEADGICYGMPGIVEPEDERDESAITLRAMPDRFRYLYDFGDSWEHEVLVVGPGGDRPGVVAGEGPCPPEDVGGSSGYSDFRRVMADPDDPEHASLRTWAGNWHDGFDLDNADLLVRQTVGQVPATVRLVLNLAADGVKLTPGGRLPRAIARQVQEHYPSWQLSDRLVSIEDDLPPLAALHDLLRHVGLLRLRNGVLAPARAAADDVEVIRRLRSWFGPSDSFDSLLVGDSLAMLAVDGACRPEELAIRLFPLLGDRWVTSQGQPLDERLVCHALFRLQAPLVGLDLIQVDCDRWTAGASALWLLPRATALAHIWSDANLSS